MSHQTGGSGAALSLLPMRETESPRSDLSGAGLLLLALIYLSPLLVRVALAYWHLNASGQSSDRERRPH
jgi:hypothetical protein